MGHHTITIRPATKDDCPRMLELIQELATYEKAPNAVTVDINHFVESGFGAQPVWWAHVAEVAGVVAGFALYYIRYSTWKGQKMYLEDIIVTESYRRQGIGRMLMDVLIADARQKKFQGITWQVLNWNQPAIDFYKQYQSQFDDEWINVALDTPPII